MIQTDNRVPRFIPQAMPGQPVKAAASGMSADTVELASKVKRDATAPAPHDLADVITSRQQELQKWNDRLARLDDPAAAAQRRQRMEQKRDSVQRELAILQDVQARLGSQPGAR